MASAKKSSATLAPPVTSFTSAGGRRFTLSRGVHEERWKGDSLWSDTWRILYEGVPAGKLFRSLSYGTGADGKPRWHATTRELFWGHASDAPTGIGFDVAAFDTAKKALEAWGRSADQILDYEEGKSVPTLYGTAKKKVSGDVRGKKPWSKSSPTHPKPLYGIGDRVRVRGTIIRGKVSYVGEYDAFIGQYRYKVTSDSGNRATWNENSLLRAK